MSRARHKRSKQYDRIERKLDTYLCFIFFRDYTIPFTALFIVFGVDLSGSTFLCY